MDDPDPLGELGIGPGALQLRWGCLEPGLASITDSGGMTSVGRW